MDSSIFKPCYVLMSSLREMIVTTPEKWDGITRKSSDTLLLMLVKLLIIDEVLNDDRGPVIEALVARTLRQVESTQSMICITGLSATHPNYPAVDIPHTFLLGIWCCNIELPDSFCNLSIDEIKREAEMRRK
ncbi:activating signal cointegrator 1 complex subunit 3 [Tanacetum coccineum]